MNAVVVESKDNKTIILTDFGEFIEISGQYEVGETMEYHDDKETFFSLPAVSVKHGKASKKNIFRVTAAAACLILALSVGMYNFDVQEAYATVSLGDGISVEYKLDKEGNVVEINATDESGEELAAELEEIGVKGKGIEEALTDARKVIEKKNSENGSAQGSDINEMEIVPEINCRNEEQKAVLQKRVEKAGQSDAEDTAAKNNTAEEKIGSEKISDNEAPDEYTSDNNAPANEDQLVLDDQNTQPDGEPSGKQDTYNEAPSPEDNAVQPDGTKGQPEGQPAGGPSESGQPDFAGSSKAPNRN